MSDATLGALGEYAIGQQTPQGVATESLAFASMRALAPARSTGRVYQVVRECPELSACFNMFMQLLPKGRAWQTGDGSITKENSVLRAFMYAVATVWFDLEEAMCLARDEFRCETMSVTEDYWLEEYGLPNECDPYTNSLCSKVSAQGGTSKRYYEDLALAAGWDVDIDFLKDDNSNYPGVRATILVTVHVATSENILATPRSGSNWRLGQSQLSNRDAQELLCFFNELIPAHLDIILVED